MKARAEREQQRRIRNSLWPGPPPPEIADPEKARAAINVVAKHASVPGLDEWNERIESLRACLAWEKVGLLLTPTDCRRLFVDLLIGLDIYRARRATHKRVADDDVVRSAMKLRREILAADAVPGMTQQQRELLLNMLSWPALGAPAELSAFGKAMPAKPGENARADRLFTINTIEDALRSATSAPMDDLIADLASAALAGVVDGVSVNQVRSALRKRRLHY